MNRLLRIALAIMAGAALLALMVFAIEQAERRADCEARGAVLAGRCETKPPPANTK